MESCSILVFHYQYILPEILLLPLLFVASNNLTYPTNIMALGNIQCVLSPPVSCITTQLKAAIVHRHETQQIQPTKFDFQSLTKAHFIL